MPKFALDNLKNSGKLFRLSSKGVVVKKYGASKQQNSAIADIERLSRWGRFFRLYCSWCGCDL